MSLGKRKRVKAAAKSSQWQDVAHGGRRRASRMLKSYKHAQTRRDRIESKKITWADQQ